MSEKPEYGMTNEAHSRLVEIAWQLKALGEAIQQPELDGDSAVRLAELVEQLANEATLITGDQIHLLRTLHAV